MYLKDSPDQIAARKMSAETMAAKLAKKPELAKILTPKFAVGCRRLTPGNGFLESLCEDHVTVVSNPIERITEKGVVTKDGNEYEADAIVCATGFDVSLLPRFPFIGKNGADLKERWSKGPVDGYMSLMVDGYPNYFSASTQLLTVVEADGSVPRPVRAGSPRIPHPDHRVVLALHAQVH